MDTEVAVDVVLPEQIDDALATDMGRLIRMMSKTAVLPSVDDLRLVAGASSTSLLVARESSTRSIVGTLTLVTFRIPTGVRAWIEDVVVDSASRGRGIGERLHARLFGSPWEQEPAPSS